MKAVIMAGGEGTRLRPLTCNLPKPMVPIINKPVMEHIVELLKKYQISDIAVTLQYMPEMIKEYFHDGKEFGVNLRYYIEQTPLGTAGSVKNAEEFLNEPFVVISGDALTDVDLNKAIEFHINKGAIATLVLKKVDIPLDYGVVVTDEEGRITRFLEKPGWGEVFSDTANTGIYILSPEVLKFYDKDKYFDFSKDLFPILLKEKYPIYGYVTDQYWCDIGDLKAYTQAHMDVMEGKVSINIPGKQIKDGVWVGEGTVVEQNVTIEPPCIIGTNCRIKENSSIGGYTVVGDGNIVGERTGIKRGIVWKNCMFEQNVQLRGCIICNKVHLKNGSSAFEYSVIGDDTVIKENAIVKPNIKLWPNKVIEAGSQVNSNLVWGSKFTRSIFGNRGVGGEINVDITPEYASKLGAAYGATFREKAKIGVSSDSMPAVQMLKMSFIAGLLSTGVEVYDLGKTLLPITRSAIRFYKFDGGIYISSSTENPKKLFIDFLDTNGSNIDRNMERKIENAFIREDFSRCEGECINEIKPLNNYSEFYLRNIINSLKSRKMKYRISLNAKSKVIIHTLLGMLEELGCEVEINDIKLGRLENVKSDGSLGNVKQFAAHIKTNAYDLGVSVEDTSEKMMLIDNKGRIITEDMFIALISIICFKTLKGGTVVVPISASQVVEKIAKDNNGKVIRSKTSSQDLMCKILDNSMKEEMLDQFTMHFDAIAGLAKILDFMNENRYKLSELVDMIPDFYMHKKEVECPWDAKGRVMRHIIEENKSESIETIEGVKIHQPDGWVLVLPDAEKPTCKVISESYSAEFAEELTNIYVNKVREISRN
ncbi:MAG: mannose-1-phosphate guanyltransferase [Clostridia bacterium]|nr:mannose-1-phosphate guanyltransferase [Clostridia bacterium]